MPISAWGIITKYAEIILIENKQAVSRVEMACFVYEDGKLPAI